MIKKSLYSLIFSLVLFVFSASLVSASDLLISPVSKSVKKAEIFTVSVVVSGSTNVNAYSGTLSFPVDTLEVISLNKSASIVDFWAQEPGFSNATGHVNFEGVTINGYGGSTGNILTISFRPKKVGEAKISLVSGSILANDGFGTNVTNKLGSSSISITDAVVVPVPKPQESQTNTGPETIKITSKSHPESSKWYSNSDVEFNWSLNKNVTAVRTSLSAFENASTVVLYEPPINKKEISGLEDGIWYFHLQTRTTAGWGAKSTYKVKIDSILPEYISVEEMEVSNKLIPYREFVLDSEDKISGVEKYSILVDGKIIDEINFEKNYLYKTPALSPGKHEIKFIALDFAGNEISKVLNFEVEALEKPFIADYSKDINTQDEIFVRGVSKYAKVNVWLEKDKILKNYEVSTENGLFNFSLKDNIEAGEYVVWVEAFETNGAKSYATEKLLISVSEKLPFWAGIISDDLFDQASKYIEPLILIISIIIIILIIYSFIRHRRSSSSRLVKRRIKRHNSLLHDEFELLQSNLETHLAVLDRIQRGLKLNDREIFGILKVMDDLKKTEMTLQSTLDLIEKDVEPADIRKISIKDEI